MYKDQLNYRHFTDRPEDEDPKAIEIKSSQEEEQLGQGFKAFLPTSLEKSSLGTPKATSAGSDGFCTHNGMLFNHTNLNPIFDYKIVVFREKSLIKTSIHN